MKKDKKTLYCVFGVLAMLFIAGSCENTTGGRQNVGASDAFLQTLSFAGKVLTSENLRQALSPKGFDAGVQETSSVYLIVKPKDGASTVQVKLNGYIIKPEENDKTKFSFNLSGDENTIIVAVTPTGQTEENYRIKASFERDAKNTVEFISFEIDGEWQRFKGNQAPPYRVSHEKDSVKLTIAPEYFGHAKVSVEKSAGISIQGTANVKDEAYDFKLGDLQDGENLFFITLTSENGKNIRKIRLSILRNSEAQDAVDVFPGNVMIMAGCVEPAATYSSPNFGYHAETRTYEGDPFVLTYGYAPGGPELGQVWVRPANEDQTITLTTENETEKYTGEQDADGMYKIALKLHDFENIVKLTVKSKNKTETGTYTVKLTRDTLYDEDYENPFWIFVNDKWEPVQFDSTTHKGLIPITVQPTPDSIKLTAMAKSMHEFCKINGIPEKRIDAANIRVDSKKARITLKDINNVLTNYSLEFVLAKPDCSLKTLKIDKNESFSFVQNSFEYFNVAVPKGDVKITATPNAKESKVTVNGKTIDSLTNSISLNITDFSVPVRIKVQNGTNEQTYTLHLCEAAESASTVEVTILVSDSIGGTEVANTKLNVYESGKPVPVQGPLQVTNGTVTVSNLKQNTAYDFELVGIKEQYAGSRYENFFVDNNKTRNITMYQFKHHDHTRKVLPPKVAKIEKSVGNGLFSSLSDNEEIAKCEQIKITLHSPSGDVAEIDGGGFGAKIAFGLAPNNLSGISPISVSKSKKTADGDFEQEFTFDISKLKIPYGKTDLVLVAYDVANNRLEKHFPVMFTEEKVDRTLEFARFKNIAMITQRYPNSISTYSVGTPRDSNILSSMDEITTYSLKPVDGQATSYLVIIQFEIVENGNPLDVSGFDIYRRKANASDDHFKRVARKLYAAPQRGSFPGSTSHLAIDSDSSLEENVEYEYKIAVFNGTSKKESPVFKTKVMESFKYFLEKPNKNACLTKAKADAMDYSCKISNPNVLKNGYADFARFGLLILNKNGGAVFGARCTYKFNNGDPDVIVDTTKYNEKTEDSKWSIKDLIADGKLDKNIKTVSDLITVNADTGVITFKNAFTKQGIFNVVEGGSANEQNGKPITYETATSYQWDILNWGNSWASLLDDKPLMIGKSFKDTDNPDIIMEIRSLGNYVGNSNNAVNGRFEFSVTSEQ